MSASERLPLAAPAPAPANDTHNHQVRPFGLRFATEPATGGRPVPTWSLCPSTQIALADDGTPWYRTVTDISMPTSGPSPDGGGSTGNEEWRPDYQYDADNDLL